MVGSELMGALLCCPSESHVSGVSSLCPAWAHLLPTLTPTATLTPRLLCSLPMAGSAPDTRPTLPSLGPLGAFSVVSGGRGGQTLGAPAPALPMAPALLLPAPHPGAYVGYQDRQLLARRSTVSQPRFRAPLGLRVVFLPLLSLLEG